MIVTDGNDIFAMKIPTQFAPGVAKLAEGCGQLWELVNSRLGVNRYTNTGITCDFDTKAMYRALLAKLG